MKTLVDSVQQADPRWHRTLFLFTFYNWSFCVNTKLSGEFMCDATHDTRHIRLNMLLSNVTYVTTRPAAMPKICACRVHRTDMWQTPLTTNTQFGFYVLYHRPYSYVIIIVCVTAPCRIRLCHMTLCYVTGSHHPIHRAASKGKSTQHRDHPSPLIIQTHTR